MKPTKRSIIDDSVDLLFDTSRASKKKEVINKDDLKLVLPTEYLANRTKTDEYKFFVGCREYILSKQKNESHHIQRYIEKCLNSAIVFTDLLRTPSIDDCVCELILQMMCQIARINNLTDIRDPNSETVIFSQDMRYKKLDMHLTTSECVLYIDGVFHFHLRLIHKILENYYCDPAIEYSDELQVDSCISDVFKSSSGIRTLNSVPTKKLMVLLVIADHACCHIFEGKCTDYIAHKHFAQQYFTLHSKLLIKPQGIYTNLLKMADVNFLSL